MLMPRQELPSRRQEVVRNNRSPARTSATAANNAPPLLCQALCRVQLCSQPPNLALCLLDEGVQDLLLCQGRGQRWHVASCHRVWEGRGHGCACAAAVVVVLCCASCAGRRLWAQRQAVQSIKGFRESRISAYLLQQCAHACCAGAAGVASNAAGATNLTAVRVTLSLCSTLQPLEVPFHASTQFITPQISNTGTAAGLCAQQATRSRCLSAIVQFPVAAGAALPLHPTEALPSRSAAPPPVLPQRAHHTNSTGRRAVGRRQGVVGGAAPGPPSPPRRATAATASGSSSAHEGRQSSTHSNRRPAARQHPLASSSRVRYRSSATPRSSCACRSCSRQAAC